MALYQDSINVVNLLHSLKQQQELKSQERGLGSVGDETGMTELDDLIGLLEDPVFQKILTINDSLQNLKYYVENYDLSGSLKPNDYDISPSEGLILSPQIAKQIEMTQIKEEKPSLHTPKGEPIRRESLNKSEPQSPEGAPSSDASSGVEQATVDLFRPEGTSLGISILGLQNEANDSVGVFVKDIDANGIAGRNGQLHEGDQIVAINGVRLRNVPHKEAISLLQNSKGRLELLVERSKTRRKSSASSSGPLALPLPPPADIPKSVPTTGTTHPQAALGTSLIQPTTTTTKRDSTTPASTSSKVVSSDGGDRNTTPYDLRHQRLSIDARVRPQETSSLPKVPGTELTESRKSITHLPPLPQAIVTSPSSSQDMVLDTEWAEMEMIELKNEGSGLGFGIVGGKSTGVVVKSILTGSVAYMDGRLKNNDHILQIGDINLRGMSSDQVASVLRNSGPLVKLVVAREITDIPSPSSSPNTLLLPTKLLNEQLGMDILPSQIIANKNTLPEEPENLTESSTESIEESLTFERELSKGDHGLGMTIAGYIGEEISGIFVKSIAAGSPADLDGNIKINDQIIEVDGQSLIGMSNQDSVEVLKNTSSSVHLKFVRYLKGSKHDQLEHHTEHEEPEPVPETLSRVLTPDMKEFQDSVALPMMVNGYDKDVQPQHFEAMGADTLREKEDEEERARLLISSPEPPVPVVYRNGHYHDEPTPTSKPSIPTPQQEAPLEKFKGERGEPEEKRKLLDEETPTTKPAPPFKMGAVGMPPGTGSKPIPLPRPPITSSKAIVSKLPTSTFAAAALQKEEPTASLYDKSFYERAFSPSAFVGQQILPPPPTLEEAPVSQYDQESLEYARKWLPLLTGIGPELYANTAQQIEDSGIEIIVSEFDKFKKGGGLGISLEGTVDVQEDGTETRPHHYIRSILPDGPLGLNGKLRSGDELLEVNGQVLYGKNHREVVKVLKETPLHIKIVCARVSDFSALIAGGPNAMTENVAGAYMLDGSGGGGTTVRSSSRPQSYDLGARPASQTPPPPAPFNVAPSAHLPPIPGMPVLDRKDSGDRLFKAKSDGALSVGHESRDTLLDVRPGATEFGDNLTRSKSLEPLHGLAMWSPDIMSVELTKGDKGLGFSILDYQDPSNPVHNVIVIRSLVPGGQAAINGNIVPGDRLVYVNDISLTGMSLDAAVLALKQAPRGSVRLGIAKPVPLDQGGLAIIDKTFLGKGGPSAGLQPKHATLPPGMHYPDFSVTTEMKEAKLIQEPSLLFRAEPAIDYKPELAIMDRPQELSIEDYKPTDGVLQTDLSGLSHGESPSPLLSTIIPPLPHALERKIKIKKTLVPLGINLETEEVGANGCIVTAITPDGAIKKDGRIKVGDYITSINNESLRYVTPSQAKSILARIALISGEISVNYIPSDDAAIHNQSAILAMQQDESSKQHSIQ